MLLKPLLLHVWFVSSQEQKPNTIINEFNITKHIGYKCIIKKNTKSKHLSRILNWQPQRNCLSELQSAATDWETIPGKIFSL